MSGLKVLVNVQKIAIEVNTKMEELGFERTLATDLYEQETKIYHKTMRFEKEEILFECSEGKYQIPVLDGDEINDEWRAILKNSTEGCPEFTDKRYTHSFTFAICFLGTIAGCYYLPPGKVCPYQFLISVSPPALNFVASPN